jgi:hypothetical protein
MVATEWRNHHLLNEIVIGVAHSTKQVVFKFRVYSPRTHPIDLNKTRFTVRDAYRLKRFGRSFLNV